MVNINHLSSRFSQRKIWSKDFSNHLHPTRIRQDPISLIFQSKLYYFCNDRSRILLLTIYQHCYTNYHQNYTHHNYKTQETNSEHRTMTWTCIPVILYKMLLTPERPIIQKKSKTTDVTKATIQPLIYNLSKQLSKKIAKIIIRVRMLMK